MYLQINYIVGHIWKRKLAIARDSSGSNSTAPSPPCFAPASVLFRSLSPSLLGPVCTKDTQWDKTVARKKLQWSKLVQLRMRLPTVLSNFRALVFEQAICSHQHHPSHHPKRHSIEQQIGTHALWICHDWPEIPCHSENTEQSLNTEPGRGAEA